MINLVAEGLSNNISLDRYETLYREGDTGELRAYLERPLYQEEIEDLQSSITGQGVTLTAPVEQDARILMIKFRKAVAPLLIIGLAVTAIVAIVGWQLFKSVTPGIPLWVWVITGMTVAYVSTRKKKFMLEVNK